jgi:hypothetical protein
LQFKNAFCGARILLAALIAVLVFGQETTVVSSLVASEVQSEPETSHRVAGPLLERPKLTGDWLGTRSFMSDSGFTWYQSQLRISHFRRVAGVVAIL